MKHGFHFGARGTGRKLTAPGQELRAIAHDAAGNGPGATKNFTIEQLERGPAMTRRLGALLGACVLASFAFAVAAGAASATTFYVNGSTGNDAHPCTSSSEPCKTIAGALTHAKEDPSEQAPQVEVAAGVYEEDLELELELSGVVLNGAGDGAGGTKILGTTGSKAVVHLEMFGAPATLSNLQVQEPTKNTGPGIQATASLTLDNVAVTMQAPAVSEPGVSLNVLGSLTINGGSVTMAKETEGTAITANAPVAINGATVTMEPGSKGTAIEATGPSASITNSAVNFEATSNEGAIDCEGSNVTLSNDTVDYAGESAAVGFELVGSLSVNGLSIAMAASKDTQAAIADGFSAGTLEHVNVSGTWAGAALSVQGGSLTLADSHLTSSATTNSTIEAVGLGVNPGLFLQRSVIQAPSASSKPAVVLFAENATLDSSEVLGGEVGVLFEQELDRLRTLTIDASTIDAKTPGVSDPAPSADVKAIAATPSSRALVNIIGSVLFEAQSATIGEKTEATVSCSYTNAPSQTQATGGSNGTIACGAGERGNTAAEPAALFSAPLTSYQPGPESVAIDSVPSSAIVLPEGLSPSSTDLLGNPRSEGIACVALQDRGAIELPGRGTPCATPAVPASPVTPHAGVISALTISPDAFLPAPSGATISTARHKPRKKYGAKVSYRDSQLTTSTFTILRRSSGRRQGSSCRRPSRRNRHGRRCTLLIRIGAFTHADRTAAISLHFSGRVKGRRLPAGSYELEAVAHDAAGDGPAVVKAFTIIKYGPPAAGR